MLLNCTPSPCSTLCVLNARCVQVHSCVYVKASGGRLLTPSTAVPFADWGRVSHGMWLLFQPDWVASELLGPIYFCPRAWLQTHTPIPSFLWVPRIITRPLMLMWQALPSLSHLPSLITFLTNTWAYFKKLSSSLRLLHGREVRPSCIHIEAFF